jgi:prepilin-type N-terminal cleavage/methylation domain-containing protein
MTQLLRRSRRPFYAQAHSAGFTLIEGLIVVVIIGLLAAIATPSLLGFLNQRKINAAQDMVYQALRATQADAMQQHCDRRFSIRQRDGRLEWASHAETTLATEVAAWQPLIDGVVFADIDNTLNKSTKDSIHYVRFDMYGNLKSRSINELGTVTLAMGGNKYTHRCVVISTVIGAMRKGEGHAKANSNERFCY